MAIDRNRSKELLDEIDSLFDAIAGNLGDDAKEWIKRNVMGPALDEIRDMIDNSRPPVMYLIGRSGHGKSSLINALANKKVTEVGDIKPTTAKSEVYTVEFEDVFATWQIIDSRGIFETTRPNGAPSKDAIQQVYEDISKYNPDVIMHVISAPEIRNLSKDLEVFENLMETVKRENGVELPTIIVLTKVDTLGNPREWPPESNARKTALIKDSMDYIVREVLKARHDKIDLNFPFKGYEITGNGNYLAIIPVCSLEGDKWNIETLSEYIGKILPKSAKLDFYQAQKRKALLKKMSSSVISRFSKIASVIGSSPIPISDIIILTPLQMMMIAIIGGLSCRSFSKDTIDEFMKATGVTLAAGVGLRSIAQQLTKFIPVGGFAISGAIAGAGTYAIGKSAEAYFFSGEIRNPDEFRDQWEG